MNKQEYTYPAYARLIHAGLALFGIAAFLTGELAEDGADSSAYYIHAYLGLSLAACILLRAIVGLAGPAAMRFSSWSPLSRRQWQLASEDVHSLMRLQVPERGMHQGLAGITQAFGLILFGWMGMTGAVLYFLGGGNALFEVVEELHEVGEALIALYLAVHVGSVVAHSLAGKPIWQRMWKIGTTAPQKQTKIISSHNSEPM